MKHRFQAAVGSACILAATLGGAPLIAFAQHTGTDSATLATPASVQWGPAPAALPPGAQAAILEGDPSKPGPFTVRLRMPAGYRVPPHYHGAPEHVTVIQGTFALGMGDTFDESKLTTLPAGSFAMLPTGHHHYALAQEESIIQLHGIGPWTITYINPSDDPRNKKQQ